MTALVLLNSGAGSANKMAARVEKAFAGCGVGVTVRQLSGSEVGAAARDFVAGTTAKPPRSGAPQSNSEILVVAGGDGTIGAAVAAVAGSDIPLGILPLGTLNHFARDLGLPLDLDKAVAVVAEGFVRRVDVVELNGRLFVNNSSVGLYPFMVAQRDAEQKRTGRSKFLATLPAALRALLGASWHRLDIVAAGERKSVRTPCLFIGNNPYETGLASFGTRKALDRGELSIHVVRQQTRLGILLLPFRIALGLVDPSRDVETFSAADLEVNSRRRHLRVSLDGEIATLQTPLRYRSRPKALCVFAPRAPTTPSAAT